MLWGFAGFFLVVWIIGMITGTTAGGFIHILLVATVAAVVVEISLTAKEWRRGVIANQVDNDSN